MRGSQVKQEATSQKWRVVDLCHLSLRCYPFVKSLALVSAVLLLCVSVGCESPDKSPDKVTKANLLYQLDASLRILTHTVSWANCTAMRDNTQKQSIISTLLCNLTLFTDLLRQRW